MYDASMVIYMLLGIVLSSSIQAQNCFSGKFCSTGGAPKYILCSRGQDCNRAPDEGMTFGPDCKIKRWLGDAQETLNYKLEGKKLTILKPEWNKDLTNEVYLLSPDQKRLNALENEKIEFSTEACKLTKRL